MITRIALFPADLAAMLDAVLQYNGRVGAKVEGVAFYDANQQPLPVHYVDVVVEEPGLAVRSAPVDGGSALDRVLNPPVADPRKVPGPASVGQLETMADR